MGGVTIYREKFDAMLIPIELGATINIGIPMSPLSGTIGAYAGYGMAFGRAEMTMPLVFGDESISIPYDGGAFMADLAAALEFNIMPMINLSLNAGYRYALVENVNVTTEVKNPLTDEVIISADEQLENFEQGKMKVNFTGFLIGAGLNIRF